MIKDLKEYWQDYLGLAVVLAGAAALLAFYRHNKPMEQLVYAGMALSYILWGIIHHYHADRVTLKIVLEYSLVAIFGFLIINSLLIWR